jgi:hypothetical protein
MFGSCFVHLPGVKIDLISNASFGPGQLAHLSFDEWQKLDNTFSGSKLKYENSKPLFFVYRFERNNITTEVAMGHLDTIIRHLAWSFILTTQDVPTPQMSIIYFLLNESENIQTIKKIGGFEREWIVFGDHYNVSFNEVLVAEVRKTFNFLLQSNDFSGSYLIMNALRTLTFTSNPEFCYKWDKLSNFNSFIYWVAALEAILMPENVRKNYKLTLTDTFGRNLAVLISNSFEDINNYVPYFSDIYRIRSKIMHGEAHSNNYTNAVAEMFKFTRNYLCTVTRSLITLNHIGVDLHSLPDWLLKASCDKKTFNDFHSKIKTKI